jgi:hypothetical protein
VQGTCAPTAEVGCKISSDCGPGNLCWNGACQSDCASLGCPAGEACDPTSHTCTSYLVPRIIGGSSGGTGTTGGNTGGTGGSTTGGTTGGSTGGTTGGSTGGATGGSTGGSGGVDAGCTTVETWSGFAHSFFASNCGCHSADAPFVAYPFFTDPAVVRDYGTTIVGVLKGGSMPPYGSPAVSASDEERILSWLNCGMPP